MQELLEGRRAVGDRAAPGFIGQEIRQDFPILARQVNGRPLVWLDNAATTQKPRAVIERLVQFYEGENSNVHRAGHALGVHASDAFEQARETVRGFLNAPDARTIVFVRGTTEAINLVAHTWGRTTIAAGNQILVSALEHHSNLVPWQMLARERGAQLGVIPIDPSGQIDLPSLDRLLTPRVKLVALAHVSNALGTVTPVREIVRRARAVGAATLVDGAQAASHLPVDVHELGADFYAFSGHKVFGPTGIGALYAAPGRLDDLPPWQGGGSMLAEFGLNGSVYLPPPHRFEAGTPNVAGAVGLAAALEYLMALDRRRVEAHDRALTSYAVRALGAIPGLHHVGVSADKVGVTSFVVDDVPAAEIGAALDQDGVAVRVGHHCALPALQALGVDSVVRPSLSMYNTTDDIDVLVRSLGQFVERARHTRRNS